ncbi:MAG: hypothetical protein WDN45_13060 [Caulobacteraceae bacterium]
MSFDLTEQPMNRVVERLTVLFVGAFAVCCVAVAVYQLVWALPAKHCEERGWWWDGQTRQCGMPVSVTSFTHRPIGAPKVAAAPKT